MVIRQVMFAISALALVAAGPAAPVRPDRPVMIGAQPERDACPSLAQVAGLNPRGDNFLSVRALPAAQSRELTRLRGDANIWACDETADGSWTGVVFAPRGSSIDCGVGSHIARRQAYRGPCTSGWVSSRFLTIVAG